MKRVIQSLGMLLGIVSGEVWADEFACVVKRSETHEKVRTHIGQIPYGRVWQPFSWQTTRQITDKSEPQTILVNAPESINDRYIIADFDGVIYELSSNAGYWVLSGRAQRVTQASAAAKGNEVQLLHRVKGNTTIIECTLRPTKR